jgi:hypothetical protein
LGGNLGGEELGSRVRSIFRPKINIFRRKKKLGGKLLGGNLGGEELGSRVRSIFRPKINIFRRKKKLGGKLFWLNIGLPWAKEYELLVEKICSRQRKICLWGKCIFMGKELYLFPTSNSTLHFFLFFYFLRASLGCLVFYFYFCQQAWDALFFFLFLPASVGCLGLPWVINLTKTKKKHKSFAPPQKLTLQKKRKKKKIK